MPTRISKAYRSGSHVGWKKTVGGREWFLGYGTGPRDEAAAVRPADVLQATWTLVQAGGGRELSQTDFEQVKALVAGGPRRPVAQPTADPFVTPPARHPRSYRLPLLTFRPRRRGG